MSSQLQLMPSFVALWQGSANNSFSDTVSAKRGTGRTGEGVITWPLSSHGHLFLPGISEPLGSDTWLGHGSVSHLDRLVVTLGVTTTTVIDDIKVVNKV